MIIILHAVLVVSRLPTTKPAAELLSPQRYHMSSSSAELVAVYTVYTKRTNAPLRGPVQRPKQETHVHTATSAPGKQPLHQQFNCSANELKVLRCRDGRLIY
jgi:hypothetical protein